MIHETKKEKRKKKPQQKQNQDVHSLQMCE